MCFGLNSLLLTIPESVGYEQNPLSLYYCYDVEEGSSSRLLSKCIAEVCLVSYSFCNFICNVIFVCLTGFSGI